MSKNRTNYIKKPKQNDYLVKVDAIAHATMNRAVYITRQQMLDKFVIALGQLGYTPEEIRYILKVLDEVEQDYCEEVLVDAADDKDMWVAREHIDKALKEYMPEDLFKPYDERFNF